MTDRHLPDLLKGSSCWRHVQACMSRRRLVAGAAVAPLAGSMVALGGALPARAQGTPTTGVNGDQGYEPAGSFDIVAEFYGPGPSGIVVAENGRIFVGFPRHAINHKGATLGELVNGRVVPWPSAALSLPSSAAPADRLMSIHGMTMDTQGRLWAIDDGKLAGLPLQPGATKIVCFDIVQQAAAQHYPQKPNAAA